MPRLPAIGSTLCRDLVVVDWLGRGGWGDVWLVESESTGARYAVKRSFVDDHANPETREAVLGEIEAWMALPNAPGIVPCYFWDQESSGELLIVVPYLSGGTWHTARQEGAFATTANVLDGLIQVTDGLAMLHARNLVHGDVTPRNILAARKIPTNGNGHWRLTDFGLATAAQRSAATSGSIPYRSLNAAEGLPRTPHDDVWSLALVGIEALTGGRFWLAGCFGTEIAALAKTRAHEASPDDRLKHALLELLAECVSPNEQPSSYQLSVRLRELHTNACGHPSPHVFPIHRHIVPRLPSSELRRFGTVHYEAPDVWWDRVQTALGTESLGPVPAILKDGTRRSTAIAAERVFHQLLSALETAIRHRQESQPRDAPPTPEHDAAHAEWRTLTHRLLADLGFAQEASGNHRAASRTYQRLARFTRRTYDPAALRQRARALVLMANRRLLLTDAKPRVLRWYDMALTLFRRATSFRGDGDPEAWAAFATVSKGVACQHVQQFEQAAALFEEVLATAAQTSNQNHDAWREIHAYALIHRAKMRTSSDPFKQTELAQAVELYAELQRAKGDGYAEHLAMAQLHLLVARPVGVPGRIENLQALQDIRGQFHRFLEVEQRADLIEHLARAYLRSAREFRHFDLMEDALAMAEAAALWMDEAVVRLGRDDLRHELANALFWQGRILLEMGTRLDDAESVVRRSLRILGYLDRQRGCPRYQPFTARARGLLAFLLAQDPTRRDAAILELREARTAAEVARQAGHEGSYQEAIAFAEQAESILEGELDHVRSVEP